MKHIINTLMERDNISREEAEATFKALKNDLDMLLLSGDIEEAYHICEDIGLEPDYLMDLLA